MFDLDLLLERELQGLRSRGLFREMRRIESIQGPSVVVDGKEMILLSSNNYLGLANHPEVIEAQVLAAKEFGAGSCASRLISGNMFLHERLEKAVADFKGTESAIVFPTGYMANIGAISALAGKEDLIVCDKLNHASIIDGVRLSGAAMRVYPHKNLERLEAILKRSTSYKKRFIISDGVFSMDGDIAPLSDIIKISEEYDAILMLDDAHGTGVLGENGKGTCEYFGITGGVHIQMGTFSKAFGNLGGFIAGSSNLIEYIRNKARAFIYSTALPPAILGGCIKAIDIVNNDAGLRRRLWDNVKKLRNSLVEMGFDIMDTDTQIIPIYTGDISSTMAASEFLFKNRVFAPGIRPPTVSGNKCRIRTSLMATHTSEQLDRVIDVFRGLRHGERIFYNRD